MRRSAKAVWTGNIKEGKGHLTTQSTVLNQTQYSFNSRFSDGIGTNPEELLAASHAGCFTMKLSADLTQAGFEPKVLETTAMVTLDGGKITQSELNVVAEVPGIEEKQFQEIAQNAEKTCPISAVLNCEISLNAKLS